MDKVSVEGMYAFILFDRKKVRVLSNSGRSTPPSQVPEDISFEKKMLQLKNKQFAQDVRFVLGRQQKDGREVVRVRVGLKQTCYCFFCQFVRVLVLDNS